jgi:hypothetical protein
MVLPDGAEERVFASAISADFEPATRGVYFVQESSSSATLKFLPYGSRSEATIASLGSAYHDRITVSPDERVALYSRYEVTNSELMLVEGFGEETATSLIAGPADIRWHVPPHRSWPYVHGRARV